jgi:hypothetical protein
MKRTKVGRPKIGRVTVTMRLYPKTKTLLKRAAKQAGLQQGQYVESLLLDQFHRDGLLPTNDTAAFTREQRSAPSAT